MNQTRKRSPRPRQRRLIRSNPKRLETTRSSFNPFRLRWLVTIILLLPLGSYIANLDAQVRHHFEGDRWALPARVYARPLEIYTGMNISQTAVLEELDSLGYRKVDQASEAGHYNYKKNRLILITRPFHFWDANETSQQLQIDFNNDQVIRMTDIATGQNAALVRIEPRLIGKIYPIDNEDRLLITLEDVPALLINALLATEDRGFYSHMGISIRGIIRAMVENIKAGEMVQGGSTITQQLVKNFYLTPERKMTRKFNEALMAVLLEFHYSKKQILEAYLNEVNMGQDGDRAIHGMGVGAQFYFNRPIEELKLHEIALLVSVVRAPSYYNPRKHPEHALERRNMILDLMADQKMITAVQALEAKIQPLDVVAEVQDTVFPYPAFLEVVRRQLREDYRDEDLRSEGLQIFTTLDPFLQKQAEESMVEGIKRLEKENKQVVKKLEGAMVITNNETGELLAIVNGKNPHYAGFNRPLNATRPIGSLVKAAVYLAALEQPTLYSLTSILSDTPYEWTDKHTGEKWTPQNYDYRSHGNIPLYQALTYSYNLATVHLGMELGLRKVHDTLKRMGIEREFPAYPSMLLGSISLSPLEVAQMYQTIASGGFRIPVRAIREVLNHDGEPLQRYGLSVEQRFDSAPIFLLNYVLQQVIRQGTGRLVAQDLPSDMVLAGKTGTTNDLRDSWFAGFGGELLAVVWLGRDDNKSMGLSGSTGAMRIWGDFIKAIRFKAEQPATPNRVRWKWIDTRSGNSSRKGASGAVLMPFISNQEGNTLADLSNR